MAMKYKKRHPRLGDVTELNYGQFNNFALLLNKQYLLHIVIEPSGINGDNENPLFKETTYVYDCLL